MLPLLYVGIISFISSFTVSLFSTREILTYNYNKDIYPSKTNSKVKFNCEILVRYIPTRESISSGTLTNLWYTKNDYDVFKKNL